MPERLRVIAVRVMAALTGLACVGVAFADLTPVLAMALLSATLVLLALKPERRRDDGDVAATPELDADPRGQHLQG